MFPSPTTGGWTSGLRTAHPAPAARIVVFPHAGGDAQRYLTPLSRLPGDVELLGITLPGRAERAAEPPAESVAEVVRGVRGALGGLPPLPTVFYGHSMGALLAVAVADAPGAAPHPGAVVVSCGLPGERAYPHPERLHTVDGLDEIFALHGLPAGALDDTSLDPRARVLAHDLALTGRALRAVRDVCLGVPLTALAGTNDPLVPGDTLPGWAAFTRAAHRGRRVEGGHFFPFSPTGADVLLEELTAALCMVGHGAAARAGVTAPRTAVRG
ncbi:thioesterase II family protein [Streptomyces botrytidirepellens]|uniref:Thioesterase n=1 Tax=Streptomyces botrytidirepellens TaxID=2486417 RepID=A0A3M8TGT8_9ACTN|nr:thioesterase domain-containing protein [Streptomyces botrytidirepellens]RNF92749.1 thioesterase [Streptomyces botrytidirepellens]